MASFKASRYLGSCFSINEFLVWHYWFTQWNWKEIFYFYFSILLACNSLKRPQGCRNAPQPNTHHYERSTPFLFVCLFSILKSTLFGHFKFWKECHALFFTYSPLWKMYNYPLCHCRSYQLQLNCLWPIFYPKTSLHFRVGKNNYVAS